MIQSFSPFEKFLSFLKQEVGKEVEPVDAVFHRDFAKYRHLPYPDSEAAAWNAGFMARTWINVILREELPEKIRLELFPKRFDLGHSISDSKRSAKLIDLITEINGPVRKLRGAKDGGKTKHHIRTTLDGIRETVGYDLSDSECEYPIKSLKVIKRLYKTKLRRSHLFTLIEQPSKREEPTLEFSDTNPIVADLVSYLSIEIPEDRLRKVHAQILTSFELLALISRHDSEITAPIRKRYAGANDRIVAAYHELAECVEEYEPECWATGSIPLDEAFYTYLRTLEFRHFVRGYEKLVADTAIYKITDIRDEIGDLCNFLNEEWRSKITPLSAELSIKSFPGFIRRYEAKFRGLIKSATGISIRKDRFDEIIEQANKVLSMYIWSYFGEKDLNAILISIADCIAALCTVSFRKTGGVDRLLSKYGEDIKRKSPKQYLLEEKTIEDLQKTDFIPRAVNELMYRKFCHVHASMTGCGQRHEAWMRFDIARLVKYAQCLESFDIDSIKHAVERFDHYCNQAVSSLLFFDRVDQWISEESQ